MSTQHDSRLSCRLHAFNHVDLYHGLQRVYSRYVLCQHVDPHGNIICVYCDGRNAQQQNARIATVALLILKIAAFVVMPVAKKKVSASRVDFVKLACGFQNFL